MSAAGGGLVVPIARGICWVNWAISLTRVKVKSVAIESDPTRLHGYIFAWFVALVAIGFLAPSHGAVALILVAIALYRLQDFLFASLDQALDLTGKRTFSEGVWQAPVLIALINLGQLVLVFGIAYHVLLDSSAFTPTPPSGRLGWLYLSWQSLPALGTGYLPNTSGARVLTVLESGIALVMLTITVARFLAGPPTPTKPPVVYASGDPALATRPKPTTPPMEKPAVSGQDNPGASGTD
jgi:hypothetical protein